MHFEQINYLTIFYLDPNIIHGIISTLPKHLFLFFSFKIVVRLLNANSRRKNHQHYFFFKNLFSIRNFEIIQNRNMAIHRNKKKNYANFRSLHYDTQQLNGNEIP